MGFPVLVNGRGMVDSDVLRVDRAVSEYDERLYFDQNHQTGDWCIFLKTPASEPDLPILGFEKVIPHPDDALKRLYHADAMRHGDKILNDMRKRNEGYKEPLRRTVDDATGQLAEGLEWAHRKTGTHPVPRIFVPGKDK